MASPARASTGSRSRPAPTSACCIITSGKKDDLYLAVLEGAYEKIRVEERGLDLEHLDPPEAIERLIDFTWNYFIRNPEFLALLNTENLARARPSQALHQGQVDAFAVRRDDPHRGDAPASKKATSRWLSIRCSSTFRSRRCAFSICRTARP